MTQIFLCVDYFVTQISQMTQIFLCGDYFVQQISQIYTDFSLWDFFQPQGGICTDRTGRLRENP